jgi:hypothetical protein
MHLALQGLASKNIQRLSDYRLQIFGVHLDCGMLVNQFECQHEPQAVALSHKSSLKTLHHTALNTNFFADSKVAIRFDPLPTEVGAQKLDLGIGKRDTLSAVAHNL